MPDEGFCLKFSQEEQYVKPTQNIAFMAAIQMELCRLKLCFDLYITTLKLGVVPYENYDKI